VGCFGVGDEVFRDVREGHIVVDCSSEGKGLSRLRRRTSLLRRTLAWGSCEKNSRAETRSSWLCSTSSATSATRSITRTGPESEWAGLDVSVVMGFEGERRKR
jgi:hypothetical protein